MSRVTFRWTPEEPVLPQDREHFAAHLVGQVPKVTTAAGEGTGEVVAARWEEDHLLLTVEVPDLEVVRPQAEGFSIRPRKPLPWRGDAP